VARSNGIEKQAKCHVNGRLLVKQGTFWKPWQCYMQRQCPSSRERVIVHGLLTSLAIHGAAGYTYALMISLYGFPLPVASNATS